ncbi:MAG TPA: F0F1 ATP synthase subunit epsilon [Candidatus Staskawiczbacteria bacterium]|nr:F0F1 ATP synthase subunit epsilon [Candidatus Staskawiczbacteria bacterium]
MKLSIYSLKRVLFQGQASSLNCKTAVGEITVLDNHHPLIGILTEGAMKVVASEKEHFFDVKSGFIEVRHGNEVRCLVDE